MYFAYQFNLQNDLSITSGKNNKKKNIFEFFNIDNVTFFFN